MPIFDINSVDIRPILYLKCVITIYHDVLSCRSPTADADIMTLSNTS